MQSKNSGCIPPTVPNRVSNRITLFFFIFFYGKHLELSVHGNPTPGLSILLAVLENLAVRVFHFRHRTVDSLLRKALDLIWEIHTEELSTVTAGTAL